MLIDYELTEKIQTSFSSSCTAFFLNVTSNRGNWFAVNCNSSFYFICERPKGEKQLVI